MLSDQITQICSNKHIDLKSIGKESPLICKIAYLARIEDKTIKEKMNDILRKYEEEKPTVYIQKVQKVEKVEYLENLGSIQRLLNKLLKATLTHPQTEQSKEDLRFSITIKDNPEEQGEVASYLNAVTLEADLNERFYPRQQSHIR